MKRLTIIIALLTMTAAAHAKTYMSQQQALASAFPAGTQLKRETFFLTQQQVAQVKQLSGTDFNDALVVRYTGIRNNQMAGFVYFDTHRVRTLPETLMIVLAPDAKVARIEILSFNEPEDYYPKRRWVEQIFGHRLDQELSLNRAIRPISGASLTGRAIVSASRKVLAIQQVVSTKQ